LAKSEEFFGWKLLFCPRIMAFLVPHEEGEVTKLYQDCGVILEITTR